MVEAIIKYQTLWSGKSHPLGLQRGQVPRNVDLWQFQAVCSRIPFLSPKQQRIYKEKDKHVANAGWSVLCIRPAFRA